ncbi:MAG: DUF547 domain-containing protein [Deltaproteobacteria bacterium]|nr:DUF547 domain-containing protein [Deltaproteobacteria bacterium]
MTKTRRYLFVATLTMALAGCGEWIKADDFKGGAGGALEDFPEVESLEHYGLSVVMERYTQSVSSPSDQQVLFDYDGLAADGEARYLLDQYLASLASVDPSKLATPAERLAYWINGYNAGVVQGVLRDYEGKANFSVVDTGSFFDTPSYVFGGETMTLNQLENLVVRGDTEHAAASGVSSERATLFATWHGELWPEGKVDARMHAAFNCAALSCPNLLSGSPFVYRAANLEALLQQNIVAWLDAAKGANAGGISQLFDWYAKDFVAHSGSVESFIETYRTDGLEGIDTTRYLDYDWTLNIAAP